ncbi:ABC transporter ATP-binding protein [Candidatus Fermentibacteria bacterium]|nr:MAG: ABC transporter ATP-binding protein [Candidatus Fermentibacteria bacterium]
MIRFFQRVFAMSPKGARDLRTAIVTHSLVNISRVLPVILAFAFLEDYLGLLLYGTPPVRTTMFYVMFTVVSFVVMYVIAYIDYGTTYTIIYDESATRRIKLAETLRELPMAFFGKRDIADLSATIMEDTTIIEQLFSHAVPQIFASVVSMLLMVMALFLYNWRMSLAMFWVVPVAFLVFYISKRTMDKSMVAVYRKKRTVTDTIQDGLDMVQEIKAYNGEKRYLEDLEDKLSQYEAELKRSELAGGALINLSAFFLKLGLPSVIFAGAFFLANGSIPLFTYLVFLIMVGHIYDPFLETIANLAALLVLNVRIDRMREMDNMPRQKGKKEFQPPNFDIAFDNVNFSYQKEMQTLSGVSFTAKQGEVTALIGPSGGGKTTAAKLAARFWDVDSGTVTLGGEDIATIDPETLLSHFSIVFQEVALFNTSVMENIRLGRKDATDAEVKEAARLAQCDEFVNCLPDGYNTLIGENGERLSGGERQRISIARALLKDAPVILLDEATASLDAENESRIQQAISQLIKDKTVIIIAHRMRTVVSADKIVAIRKGRVVESGTPEELRQKEGMFAAMLQSQNEQT